MTPQQLREKAREYRQLALTLTDEHAIKALIAMAKEHEKMAGSVDESQTPTEPSQDQPYPEWSDIRAKVTRDLPNQPGQTGDRDWSKIIDEPDHESS